MYFVYLNLLFAVKNDTIVFLLEPLHGVLLCQTMGESNLASLSSSVRYIEPCNKWKILLRLYLLHRTN